MHKNRKYDFIKYYINIYLIKHSKVKNRFLITKKKISEISSSRPPQEKKWDTTYIIHVPTLNSPTDNFSEAEYQ